MYWIYILRTSGNTLYIGQTNNLEKRLIQHKAGKVGAKYLRMFTSFELVYSEEYQTRSEALKREFELKKLSRIAKEAILTKKPSVPLIK